jgi:hypothetical protein
MSGSVKSKSLLYDIFLLRGPISRHPLPVPHATKIPRPLFPPVKGGTWFEGPKRHLGTPNGRIVAEQVIPFYSCTTHTHTHARTHARAHARTHARTHTRTHAHQSRSLRFSVWHDMFWAHTKQRAGEMTMVWGTCVCVCVCVCVYKYTPKIYTLPRASLLPTPDSI